MNPLINRGERRSPVGHKRGRTVPKKKTTPTTKTQAPPPSTAAVVAGSIAQDAKRLGITWTLRSATTGGNPTSAQAVPATYDGDTQLLTMTSLIGTPQPNTRVACIQVPPSGNFIIGNLTGQVPANLTRRSRVAATSDLTLTTAAQDIPGGAISLIVTGGCAWEAYASFDFSETVSGTTVATGILVSPNATETSEAIFGVTTAGQRATVAQNWSGEVLDGGTLTFTLRALKTINTGTVQAKQDHTTLLVKIYQ